MKSGIYCIENLINGKKYVGQGIDIEKRMNKTHNDSSALNNAFRKYGKDNFKKYVLVYCEVFELDGLEMALIKFLKSHISEHGYNISFGGNTPMLGWKHSEETKRKMSIAKAGEKHFFWGKHHSDKTKIKISESLVGEKNPLWGKHKTEDMKRRISLATSGQNNFRFGKKMPNSSSKYFGVCKYKPYKDGSPRYVAKTKLKNIGYFKLEIDAAKAYDKYITDNSLPNPLNFAKTAS